MVHEFPANSGEYAGASAVYERADPGCALSINADCALGEYSKGRSTALFSRNHSGGVVRQFTATGAKFFQLPPAGICDPLLLTSPSFD